MVIQLAKRSGLKVIASAGSDEKINFIKEIGADVVFNYKTMDTREVLEREGPIDMCVFRPFSFCSVMSLTYLHVDGCRYWDNVGGDTLDAALEHANVYGRFIVSWMFLWVRIGELTLRVGMRDDLR
jgi:NADPH-dependent curcumin reductase CurA